MSERLPYEEQLKKQWDDLSLPDENMAWADMKRRLEEDNDDRVLVPPVKKGCGRGMLLIALLLLVGLWFLLRPDQWFTGKKYTDDEKTEQVNVSRSDSVVSVPRNNVQAGNEKKDDTLIANDVVIEGGASDDANSVSKIEERPNVVKSEEGIEANSSIKISQQTPTVKNKKNVPAGNANESVKTKIVKGKTSGIDEPIKVKQDNIINRVDKTDTVVVKTDAVIVSDTNRIDAQIPITDTQVVAVNDKQKDSLDDDNNITDSIPTLQPIKPQKEKRKIFFGAGLSIHQQIPIAGQQSTTYGALGRKGLLSDYIPAPYFRMEKDRRWFIETGFRYGAPQHTKALTYKENSVTDTAGGVIVINTSSSQLKKTFYHQLPLSFNYYLRDNWTIGTGIVLNRFHSAVIEKQERFRIPASGIDSVLDKTIQKISKDSALADGITRSWTQAFFQMQYQWRKFTLGTRYSIGLQPYIRFTLPNTPPQAEKNSSFQIFLKYEFWRSKE